MSTKASVHAYWNKESCGTDVTIAQKFTKQYFEDIEEYRYSFEPEIMPFAQFSRAHGKSVLEVGVGAGTDFIQWVRSGAIAYGIDLTEEGIANVQNRLKQYELTCQDLRVGDAENLPYPSNHFDITYSWGVIHHSPNPLKALEEAIRVTKPNGKIKIMVYNRRSPYVVYKYIRWGLMKARPFKSIEAILADHQESPGTKAYTIKEIKSIASGYPVLLNKIDARATNYDLLPTSGLLTRFTAYLLSSILGFNRCGWFLCFELTKNN